MSWRPTRSWLIRIVLAVTAGFVVLAGTACGPDNLYRLRMCESGGNYRMASGGYGGAYSFSIYYWRAAGNPGLPQDASPAYQDMVAARLLATSPHQSFPGCSASLGL